MSKVVLGVLEPCENWLLESRFFPSKAGGKPAWLSLKSIPTTCDLTCEKCGKVMVFLCQIYVPLESNVTDQEQLDNNFHRSVYVFICRTMTCNESRDGKTFKVFRSNLPRINEFYPKDPAEETEQTTFDISKWVKLCNLCGIAAQQKCSKCKGVVYCCKEHQIIDWKNGHKSQCSNDVKETSKKPKTILFDELEIVNKEENYQEQSENEHVGMEEYNKLKADGKTGTIDDAQVPDLEVYASDNEDKVFEYFRQRTATDPDQVLRYDIGGKPLFIAKEPRPSHIPNCQYCGGPRQFEFQVMPQMLYDLYENELDFGVLLVYTCKNSCIGDSIYSYKEEYIFRQDVSSDNIKL
ncbi:hypothetical protein ABEB36_005268 [Hypothenemus hampei]|uniref:MYND-type domain-containing protein n=1 Tax=Hypothenemus hampei TaxID=57062 RepID=A0ABD1EXM2_HYPHA